MEPFDYSKNRKEVSYNMRKLIGLVAVLMLGALPAIAFAEAAPAQKSAAQLCQEQKKAGQLAIF